MWAGIIAVFAGGLCSSYFGLCAINSDSRQERTAWLCATIWALSSTLVLAASVIRGGVA